MGKRWFAAVKKGIGWYPVTWQGWAIVAVYAFFIVWDYQRLSADSKTTMEAVIKFLPEAGVATAILAFICFFTGEKPRT